MLFWWFLVCVLVGFLAWFLATYPVPQAERVARAFFFIAACLWAFTQVK